MRRLLVILACLVTAACSQKTVLEKVSSPEDRALAQQTIQSLSLGDSARFLGLLHPTVRAQAAPLFLKMRAILPPPPIQVELVDARFNSFTLAGGTTTRSSFLIYEVDHGDRRAVVQMTIQKQGSEAFLTQVQVNPLYKSISELQRFSLSGKSPLQYGVLVLALASVVTIVAALAALFRTPGVRRKWLWGIGCALGFGVVAVDWNSGALSYGLLNVQLFGAFVIKSGALAPWRVGFGLPIVAVIFLLRRRELQRVT